MTDTNPKRRYPRLGTQRLVIVNQADEEVRKEPARTRSMGPGGLSLELKEALPLGTLLGLHVSLGTEVLKVDGRVAYCRPLPSGGQEVGIEFTELDPEERHGLMELLVRQAAIEESLFATSLAVEITRFIEERRAQEPKISHEDSLAALELVRLRLEEREAR